MNLSLMKSHLEQSLSEDEDFTIGKKRRLSEISRGSEISLSTFE